MNLTNLIQILDTSLNNRTIVHCKKEGYEDAITYTNKNKTITINDTTCSNTLRLFITTKNDTAKLYLEGQNPYNHVSIALTDISTITLT